MMLDTIFSANEQSLRPLCGRTVYVIMNDETRYTGILTSCGQSSITLNGKRERSRRPVKRTRKAKIQAGENIDKPEKQTSTSAYWGNLSFDPPIELSNKRTVIPLAPIKAVILL
jgi:small nuclear ribonucleoprotein (snRNP)-like protein